MQYLESIIQMINIESFLYLDLAARPSASSSNVKVCPFLSRERGIQHDLNMSCRSVYCLEANRGCIEIPSPCSEWEILQLE
ncbi:hypothetical protein KCU83_g468, partial [Aureobasidium melanogenum]